MSRHSRHNPLALAVLITLIRGDMHPYEIATTLRREHKDDSIRLNYGSLYSVVCALERRGLIVAQDTEREGRLGLMLFTVAEASWTNQSGELVKRTRTTVIRY